jgi:hypothetical protein
MIQRRPFLQVLSLGGARWWGSGDDGRGSARSAGPAALAARARRSRPEPVPAHRPDRDAGQRGRPVAGRGSAAVLGGSAGLDRAGPDVPQPGRRDRGHLLGGLPPLQPCPRQPHGNLLLVGLGPDVWSHSAVRRLGPAPLVPADAAHHGHGDSHRPGLHGAQPGGRSSRSSPVPSTGSRARRGTSRRPSRGSSAASPAPWPGST